MSASKKEKAKIKETQPKVFTHVKKEVLSDIKQKMLQIQEKTERKLEELTYICLKEENNGK